MQNNFSLSDIVSSIILLLLIVTMVVLYFRKKNQIPVLGVPQHNCHEDAYKLLPEAIVILNANNRFVYLNPAAEKMLSCKLRSVMGKSQDTIFEFLHLKTSKVLQGVLVGGKGKQENERECLLQTKMNQTFPVKLNLIPLIVVNDSNEESHTLLVLKNIAEKKALQSKLSDLENYDGLTRMLNRRSFEASVKQLIDTAHKHNASHVLVYFSIDQFQVLNDTIGHAGGDSLITGVSNIVKDYINKSTDILGRMGGSTFSVVYRDQKLTGCIKDIESIINEVSEHKFMSAGKQYPVTVSAGFIIVDSQSTSPLRVISEATRACNLASKGGGNRLSAYIAENDKLQEQEGNLEWVMVLKNAIQNNLFEMYAQPIHKLEPEEYKKPFSHYELLIRLFDKDGNFISPDEFISAAEYYSMMPAIDRWVVHNVLQQLSKIPKQTPLPVFAINLSGQSLNDSRFLDYVFEEIKRSGVDPQMLCFEITEQVAVEDITLVNNFIAGLKELGSSFSLDDFGTGMSSYGFLRSLDVDYLKIDGSFVKHIATDEIAKAMVQSINQVGHTMNLKVIAEYVENAEIVASLQEMGIDYGQGYHISKPKPLKDMIKPHLNVNKSALV
ncbi:MAG TPA: EAL domain-containing protein [Leucothrix sp.]|nr:EAL domain-containing protein [Leucothrix sp.]